MSYTLTGREFKETINDTDDIFGEMVTKSEKNLCDMQDNECKGNNFHTDDQYAITHFCTPHFNELIKNGTFKITKEVKK